VCPPINENAAVPTPNRNAPREEETEMRPIREVLQDKPLLFDGGMGTYYKAAPGVECEQANLSDPSGVRAVHEEYLAAGADAIKANTFGVSRMAAAGNAQWKPVLQAGYTLAREAAEAASDARRERFVFADIGPAPAESAQAGQVYGAVADAFLACGAKNFLFETMSTDEGIARAAARIKNNCPDAFVLVSFAVLPDGYTREGLYYKDLLQRMAVCGSVDAVGLNCVSAPGAMAALLRQAADCPLPLAAMPNAGYPMVTRDRVVYRGRPDYFAQELAKAAQEIPALRFVGGCCGTTPAHIAATCAALAEKTLPPWRINSDNKQANAAAQPEAQPETQPDTDAFLRRLQAGKRVIAVELDPPKSADLAAYMDGARRLQAAGADALTIADCPIARARMDSSLLACKVKRELGLTALPHMTCRDRNLNATKALLLGLYAEGVREVLAITGDPIPTAERDEVKSVYQFNSRKLAQYIVSLGGRDMPGALTVFGALNLNARNFEVELRRAEEKVHNGMTGFLTQPILSAEALENLKAARAALPAEVKILAGIIPVVSQRNAIFMENEVNGIHVTPEIIALYEGKDREQGEALALRISMEVARAAAPYADGFYLMTPFNRVALMERLIAQLKAAGLGE
jgi:homocysteine S-methyltransferase